MVPCFHAVAGKRVSAGACLRPGGEGMAPIVFSLSALSDFLVTARPPKQRIGVAGGFTLVAN
jgi:hypothetical protein